MPIAEKNKKNLTAMDTYAEVSRFVVFKLPLALYSGRRVDEHTLALMLDSIFSVNYGITINDLMVLWMRAIT
jgi:hypothetical protein